MHLSVAAAGGGTLPSRLLLLPSPFSLARSVSEEISSIVACAARVEWELRKSGGVRRLQERVREVSRFSGFAFVSNRV